MLDSIAPAGAGVQAQEQRDPAKILKAAQDFEALLIGQMLKNMRESGGGWLGTGEEDQAGEQAMSVAEEFFARSLAAQGGLGLSRMVAQGLSAPSAGGPGAPQSSGSSGDSKPPSGGGALSKP